MALQPAAARSHQRGSLLPRHAGAPRPGPVGRCLLFEPLIACAVRPSGCQDRNNTLPRIAIRAGTSVNDTIDPTMTVIDSAGPKARKSWKLAASRAAVPAATVLPATATIGPSVATVRRVNQGDLPDQRCGREDDHRQDHSMS